jgi:pimeloyl-ACP methyl ester carboxylesterase
VSLTIADHLTILRMFLESVVRELAPKKTILIGMSSGADVVLRMVAEGGVGKGHIDGVLALSPNISLETCFFTRRVTEIDEGSERTILDLAREVAGAMDSPQEWVEVTPYLVELVRKFHADIDSLRDHSRDIIAPFLCGGDSPLAGWYRAARAAGVGVRMVFAGAEGSERQALRRLMLDHVDRRVLGPDFADADIVVEPDTLHMGLIAADIIERHLEAILSDR